MSTALLFARLLLAAVFVLAGAAKLADLAGSRKAMRDFGLPGLLAAPFGLLLPLAEIGVAVALVPTPTAWAGAIAALVLLLLFMAGIAVNLARGRKPDCHCFGQIHSEPAGWSTLARNTVLAAVAAFVVWQGRSDAGRSALGWLSDLTTAERAAVAIGVAGLVLAAVTLWLLLQLVAQNGRLLSRLDGLESRIAQNAATGFVDGADGAIAAAGVAAPLGLPAGSPAPVFSLSGLYGETLTLDALRAQAKPVLLAFADPGCGPCTVLMPDLGRWQRDLAGTVTLAVISRGTVEENRAKSIEHGLTHVLLQQDREVAMAYQSYGTPGAVLVRADGTIGSAVAQGSEEIRALVARARGDQPLALPLLPAVPVAAMQANGNGHGPTPCPQCGRVHDQAAPAPAEMPAVAPIGQPAPKLALPDLTGKAVDLADYRGRETLVLFWNPGCGFCQQMLPDLKAWEANRPQQAPALLIDEGFGAGATFGANGTPMAVLIDAAGNVASAPAAGADAVFGLAGGKASKAEPL